ncbi:MAG: binding domain [Thermoleophilia bacterium]|nr:binding domain [Thermoleophilia bacterium]
MGINLIRDIVLQRFAESAKRMAVGAETLVATYGDEALDGRQAFQADILAMRCELGTLSESYKHVLRDAPDAVAALTPELREQMQVAVRAAEAASDTWHEHRGASSVAPFAALADAATGVAEIVSSGAAFARPVRVVVGGEGPAGLATANLLRESGADVQLMAPVGQARNGSVMIDRRGWGVLERAGGAKVVAEAPVDHTGNFKMASLPWLERELGTRAKELGIRRQPFAVADVEQLDDGVRVHVADPRAGGGVTTIDADWYIDATGGSSPISKSNTFGRELFEGSYGALPSERTFIAASAKAVEGRGLGWTAKDGTFAINDVREGVLTAYRGLDEVDKGMTVTAEQATQLLRTLEVDPSTMIGTPWSFTAQQTLARSAGQGRVLIVGDGAGTVMPVQQAGVFLALTDAERAAKTVIGARNATREAIDDAVRAFDAESRQASTGAVAGPVPDSGHGVMRGAGPHGLEQIAEDAGDAATAATEQATRAHDEQTRMMHRVFLA